MMVKWILTEDGSGLSQRSGSCIGGVSDRGPRPTMAFDFLPIPDLLPCPKQLLFVYTIHHGDDDEQPRHAQPHHADQAVRPRPTCRLQARVVLTSVSRLEAATSRLEDIATSSASFDQPRGTVADAGATHLPASSSAPELPGIAKHAAQSAPPAAPAPQADTRSKPIQEMDNLIDEHVAKFVSSASGLDKNIETQVHSSL